jgi:endonuclease/exonuclease/phosphatase family metal-dependent hydrolase
MTTSPHTKLDVSVFNYQAGGLRADGTYDFSGLTEAFRFIADPAPDLLVLCEAKFWGRRGRTPGLAAIRELATMLDRPYVGELHQGPLGTAVIYDPTVLRLTAAEEPEFADKRNRTVFRLGPHDHHQLQVFAEHWSYCDPAQRLARARQLAPWGISKVPTLIAGDLNESASGPHFPEPHWEHVPYAVRDHAARQTNDTGGTRWVRQTAAIDRLIGPWYPESITRPQGRGEGSGFHHVAELDPNARRPLDATSNVRDLHGDHALVNNALLQTASIAPGSFRVHVPHSRPADWPSDHRRVSFTIGFTGGQSADDDQLPADRAVTA